MRRRAQAKARLPEWRGRLKTMADTFAASAVEIPAELPFLESLSWFDARWRELSPMEMLRRYERGFRHLGVTADLSGEEAAFLRALVARFGSDLDVPA
jgi:hypothetical protein